MIVSLQISIRTLDADPRLAKDIKLNPLDGFKVVFVTGPLDFVRPMCFPRERLWKPRWLPIIHCKIPEKTCKIPEKMFRALVFWIARPTKKKKNKTVPKALGGSGVGLPWVTWSECWSLIVFFVDYLWA